MKIAIPTDKNRVAAHFGRCEKYTIFTTKGNQVMDVKEVENPGHEPGFLPKYLADLGIECIIASGMGRKAQDLFEENKIAMILGCQGQIKNIIEEYSKNTLIGGESTCDHSENEHNCQE